MQEYSIDELENDNELELLKKLKLSWGYSEDEKFIVFGKLKKVDSNGNPFYFLESLRSIHDSSNLKYPINVSHIRHNIFAGSLKKFNIHEETDGNWAKAEVSLSPISERNKHQNPFVLMTLSIELLTELPFKDIDNSKIDHVIEVIDNNSYLKKTFYDYYYDKVKNEAKKELESLEAQISLRVEELKNESQKNIDLLAKKSKSLKKINDKTQNEVNTLKIKKSECEAELAELTVNLEKNIQLINKSKSDYQDLINNLGENMAKLNEILESKAEILKKLDLISDSDLEKFFINFSIADKREGHDFKNIFNSDYSQAIAYIQSYMWQNKIIYKRSVLEDFFALVSTHDLIILAGDSGSGKTNLIKSFAKAIGGKSIIVPVKPNWTSAEDLLGYYNPLENKYISTKFLDALLEAQQNPNIPYFICLDEMNLARVEYYFADFLSLLEERDETPEIQLFSSSEGEVLASELKNFISLVNETSEKLEHADFGGFIDIMKDEEFNAKLHELCGFKEGDSLLKYHSYLKRMLNSFLNTPSSIKLPKNVRIIGAINIDETTHYLSPKILDRAHIMKFGSPLLADWSKIEDEIQEFDLDISLPLKFTTDELGVRQPYPEFDRNSELVKRLIILVKNYLDPLGIEFGLRTIRQALGYSSALALFETDDQMIMNNIVLHKILPKLLFDGEKSVNENTKRRDILEAMNVHIQRELENLELEDESNNSIMELQRVIKNAETNDWVVNYWSR